MANKLSQDCTPIFNGLKKYIADGTIPFHVPGHKQGRGLHEFRDFVGEQVMAIDLTCFAGTDNICNPLDVIKEAQELTAEAYGADHAYFLVNGTTSGIQAMIMSVCQPGDKLIVPRNAHKSAIGGIILSGAIPVYIQPEIDEDLGIAVGVTPETLRRALHEHPDAKGVFIVNPTYYGFTSNLKEIVKIAHNYDIPVIVDEAHGAHLPFHPDLPMSAMAAGADLSAVSTHKMGGSLTQSSVLLLKKGLVDPKRVKAVLNLSQTTSPSYILLASIDVARKQMVQQGHAMLSQALELAHYARIGINSIDGLAVVGDDQLGQPGRYGWDPTKLIVDVRGLGLSGFEVETLLRRKYKIQVELADLYNVLFIISIGDDRVMIDYLINCMRDIAADHTLKNVVKLPTYLPDPPEQVVSPQEAFYSDTRLVALEDAEGKICAEMIMAYPPGIPLICPGEVITQEIIDYVRVLKHEHCQLQGTEDPMMERIKVLSRRFVLVQPSETQVG
ncbi:MAG: aminotransferase class I/II-fold pyridoxal phosphate-dependent enzyme [Clostridia bacterium]|nr:aminotransferase class I/II-fold pyridoxal phosphate-dependent enzyme [Clostridia bacterium]